METIGLFLKIIAIFFLLYLLLYITFLLLSVIVGAINLYDKEKKREIKNELKHEYYFPISIIVPAYNEEVTILDSIKSLLNLDYKLYEIIVVDDGSKDNTSQKLIDHYNMIKVDRPIRKVLKCQEELGIYEAPDTNVSLTLIKKKNGGKGDVLNMGINASKYPYFVCIDADSVLQKDSLERIAQPVIENENVVAVGGYIRIAQSMKMKDGEIENCILPANLIVLMQIMEYDRSFLASRILMNEYNGNLIISGAFGLFKKETVIAVGGYDCDTLGEDMELVVKLHDFCCKHKIKYQISYEPSAVCWSEAPSTLKDLKTQRVRWHRGLFQCMHKYREMFLNPLYGLIGSISYLYYLIYELLSPVIEIFGLFATILAGSIGLLNIPFMIRFYLIYALFGALLTITSFLQRVYTQNLRIYKRDVLKVTLLCLVENSLFRLYLDFIRMTAFIGYKKKRTDWGELERKGIENN